MDDEDLLAEDRELEEREECIQDVLELIVERVNAHLEAAELQGKVVGYAVREAVKDALAVVDMTFVERESSATRGSLVAEDTRGSWEPDDEPVPGPVDAWARGAVKARKRQKAPGGGLGDAKSTLSYKQTSGTTLQRNTSRMGGVSSRSIGDNKKSAVAASTRELPKPKVMRAKLSPEDAEREQRLKEEIESRRAVQEMQRLQLEKDEEELRQLENLQKEMRGKDYGYDHKGQVVVLNKLDPERLPAFAVGLRVNVFEHQDGFEDEVGGVKRNKNLGGKKLNEVDFIEQEKSGQPSVMETMQVAMGVTLREGGGAKAGPPLTTTKQNMSRKDFMDLVGRNEVSAEKSGQSRTNEKAGGWGFADDALGAPPSAERSVLPDPNLALLAAADWGVNPPSAMKERPYVPPTQIPKAKPTALDFSVGKGVSRYPRTRPFSKTTPLGGSLLNSPSRDSGGFAEEQQF